MSANAITMPGELRNMIWEELLVHDKPINPWLNRGRWLNTSLFRVNKWTDRETPSIFYSRNRFDFTTCTQQELVDFFRSIGRRNSDYIQHLYIRLPRCAYRPDIDNMVFSCSTRDLLLNIRQFCVNVCTITTSLASTTSMEKRLAKLGRTELVLTTLRMIRHWLAMISCLRETVFGMYEKVLSKEFRAEIKRCGIRIKEYSERAEP